MDMTLKVLHLLAVIISMLLVAGCYLVIFIAGIGFLLTSLEMARLFLVLGVDADLPEHLLFIQGRCVLMVVAASLLAIVVSFLARKGLLDRNKDIWKGNGEDYHGPDGKL